MDVSIIVVSWNVRDLLDRCLASIYTYTTSLDVEVFVVDNYSGDGTVDMIRSKYPKVKLKDQKRNTGFARANNRAISEAQGRYVFLLNPDTELQKDSVSKLVGYMDKHNDVSLVAPKIVNTDGTFQKGSVRRQPTLLSQLMILLKVQHFCPKMKILKDYYFSDFNSEQEQSVDQIMGAAMFFRRSVFQRIGYFDEKFFLWFEEVDLCTRLRRAGELIQYYPEAQIIHHGGKSFEQSSLVAKQKILYKSMTYYFLKQHGIVSALVIKLATSISLVIVYIYQALVSHGKRKHH